MDRVLGVTFFFCGKCSHSMANGSMGPRVSKEECVLMEESIHLLGYGAPVESRCRGKKRALAPSNETDGWRESKSDGGHITATRFTVADLPVPRGQCVFFSRATIYHTYNLIRRHWRKRQDTDTRLG
jgi:hypothetical protein